MRQKQNLASFISMTRQIDADLPRPLLETLYESIKIEPFQIPPDDGNDLMHTFFNPIKEGEILLSISMSFIVIKYKLYGEKYFN